MSHKKKEQSFEAKIESLKIIQGIIGRMSEKSKQVKIWAITIVSGLSVFYLNKPKTSDICQARGLSLKVTLVIIIACVILASFNAFYLSLNRRFTHIYDHLSKTEEYQGVNFLEIKSKIKDAGEYKENTWQECMMSKSIFPFYSAIILLALFIILI